MHGQVTRVIIAKCRPFAKQFHCSRVTCSTPVLQRNVSCERSRCATQQKLVSRNSQHEHLETSIGLQHSYKYATSSSPTSERLDQVSGCWHLGETLQVQHRGTALWFDCLSQTPWGLEYLPSGLLWGVNAGIYCSIMESWSVCIIDPRRSKTVQEGRLSSC